MVSFKLVPWINIFVSSGKKVNESNLLLLGKSFIFTMNKTGQIKDPCGITPFSILLFDF